LNFLSFGAAGVLDVLLSITENVPKTGEKPPNETILPEP
jgi:hypothetical protein